MDMKLEVVPIPVSDVDAAKAFYTQQVGFHLDHDIAPKPSMRVVQMTPPGRACRWARPARSKASSWWWRTSTPSAGCWSSAASA